MIVSPDTSRVVLITGAAHGIGRLCALELAARGWRVFGADRDLVQIDNVEMVQMDVDDDESVAQGVGRVVAEAGRLDALVNCAGFSLRGSVEDVSLAEARSIMETNFFGVLRLCKTTAPHLRASKGAIVNIGSLAGQISMPFTGHYCASKAALEALSESLRFELRPFGVAVSLIEPGDFKTNIHVKRRISDATKQGVYRQAFEFFLKRRRYFEEKASTPEPVATLVAHILETSNPAFRYVIAMPSQRSLLLLKNYAPRAIYEWILQRNLSG